MTSNQFEQLENALKTLGKRAFLSSTKKTMMRDKIFRSIGQIELADAIASGESKSKLFVSLDHLKRALIPHKLSFSMPATIAVVILVFFGSITMGAIAQSSSPGRALFGVKKVFESIELAFVRNPIQKAQYQLDIADERLKYFEESGDEEVLQQVLRESQIALVSAREALQRVQAVDEDQQDTSELVERFSALLDDQRAILKNLEGTSEDEEIQKTIVAIRETLSETSVVDDPSVLSEEPTSVVIPNENEPVAIQPLVDGNYTFVARVSTYNGKPVIAINDTYYTVTQTPVSLVPYIGFTLEVSGRITGNDIAIYKVEL